MSPDPRSLLIYAPVPLFRDPANGSYLLEDQACNGLRLWTENFDRLIVMFPLSSGTAPPSWVPINQVGPNLARIQIEPLPMAYRPDQFARNYVGTRKRIDALIDQADLVGFAIGGLFGDWGAVSCWAAYRKKRPYYVWTDRVESEVTRHQTKHGPFRKRLRARLTHRPMAWLERAVIRRAALGLFHGKETFDAYAPYCGNPHLVHDIHLKKKDHIQSDMLSTKMASVASGSLRIGYLGRAEEEKGATDWVNVLLQLNASGMDFSAIWLGDGTVLAEMKALVECAGLSDRISFPGFSADRDTNFAALRDLQVFLFCHRTKESPRCLIEALVSGTPIVGYDGSFAQDLISSNGGGLLVAKGNTAALTEAVIGLNNDRDRLARMIKNAARDGASFDDEMVFKHRSQIIIENLGPLEAARKAKIGNT